MKHASALLLLFFITACKVEDQPAGDVESPAPTPAHQNMLQAQGCSALKANGRVQVQCSDGSQAVFGAPAVHIKDGNGASMDNLLYVGTFTSTQVILNTTSHNVLSYDGAGNVTAVTRTYFDGPNCTGNAYTVPPDVVIKNKVMANSQAWPDPSVGALRIVGYSAMANARSQFQSGACSAFVTQIAHVSQITATSFDSSDLLTLTLPLELVSE